VAFLNRCIPELRNKEEAGNSGCLSLGTYYDRHDLYSSIKSGAHFRVIDVCYLKQAVKYARQILSLGYDKNKHVQNNKYDTQYIPITMQVSCHKPFCV
jgi:hypothetical protein